LVNVLDTRTSVLSLLKNLVLAVRPAPEPESLGATVPDEQDAIEKGLQLIARLVGNYGSQQHRSLQVCYT
jgi:hypothetical protein